MANNNMDDWDESLEDFLGCVADLETEDVVYLEEYLSGRGEEETSCSLVAFSPLHPLPSSVSSSWSVWERDEEQLESIDPFSHVRQRWEKDEDGDDVSSSQADDLNISRSGSSGGRAVRVNKGIKQPKFVSYQSLRPTKGHGSKCEVCGLWLSSHTVRRRHILARHVKERSNTCDVCGKAFVFKFALKTHKAVHAPSPSHVCVCGASFNLRSSYMDHVRRIHHAATAMHTCHLCFKSFYDRYTLRVHLVSVHKPKTVACQHPGCPKVFSTKGLMRSHYRYHLNQRFTCDECGKNFSTEAYMYKHRLTHSGIRPHRCLDCGQTYLSVSHLNKHRRAAHSNLRPHQCSICGKCYKSRDHLTFHESSHRGEKPYKCVRCGYATAYRNTYYAHRKKCLSSAVQSTDHSTSANTNVSTAVKNEVSLQTKVMYKGKLSKTRENFKAVTGETTNSNKELTGYDTVLPHILNCSTSDCVSSGEDVVVTGGGGVDVLREGMTGTEGLTALNFICLMSGSSSNSDCLHRELPSVEQAVTEGIHLSTDSESIKVSSSSPSFSAGNLTQVSPRENIPIEEISCIQNSKLELLRLFTHNDSLSECEKTSLDKQDSLIFICNIGKCAVHNCDNNNSLLLLKTEDNSYIGLCNQHALVDSQVEVNETENRLVGSEDSSSPSMPITSLEENGVSEITVISKEGTVEDDVKESHCHRSRNQIQPPLASVAEKISAQSDSAMQLTSNLPSSCNPPPPLQHGKAGLEEQFSTMLEYDSGVASLSGHIVDDSCSLTQLEVQCPLCDQFLSMDAYVTHLECSHN